jgi:hypothetical protein
MPFELRFTDEAKSQFEATATDERKHKKIAKCFGLIQTDPKHPSLHSHKYSVMKALNGSADVWESYVENNTPAAWRVFWIYGPEKGQITIVAVTEHP